MHLCFASPGRPGAFRISDLVSEWKPVLVRMDYNQTIPLHQTPVAEHGTANEDKEFQETKKPETVMSPVWVSCICC